MDAKSIIESGNAILGIEFGSTRIKGVLIDADNNPIAQGSHTWENQLVDGLWTYSIDAIWSGLQDCYAQLCKDVNRRYGIAIHSLAAIGISAMMHGYMPSVLMERYSCPSGHGGTPTRHRRQRNSPSCSISTSRSGGASHTSTRLYSMVRNTLTA